MDLHLRRALSVLTILLLGPEVALGCPICFDGLESPLLDSARLGVLAMATLTVAMLGVFAAWFRRLARLESLIANRSSLISRPNPQSPIPDPDPQSPIGNLNLQSPIDDRQ